MTMVSGSSSESASGTMHQSAPGKPQDAGSTGPVATIVTVSDHKTGDAQSWEALRRTYRHLAQQDMQPRGGIHAC